MRGKIQLKCTKPLVSPDLSFCWLLSFFPRTSNYRYCCAVRTYVDQKLLQVKLNLLLKPKLHASFWWHISSFFCFAGSQSSISNADDGDKLTWSQIASFYIPCVANTWKTENFHHNNRIFFRINMQIYHSNADLIFPARCTHLLNE